MILRTLGKNILSYFPLLDGLFRRFFWSKWFFPENEMIFFKNLPKDSFDISIDVGAALGSYAWLFSRISKTVYAFEPGVKHFEYLRAVIFFSRIKLSNLAIGDSSRVVNLYTPGNDTHALHSATLSDKNPIIDKSNSINVTKVKQVSLDDFFKNVQQDRTIDLLKVDVEGYENIVFKGARYIIKKFKPIVICEIEARHNKKYVQVFTFFKKLGYKCYILKLDKLVEYKENNIQEIQKFHDLQDRLSPSHNPKNNRYINNFLFQHPFSKVKVAA